MNFKLFEVYRHGIGTISVKDNPILHQFVRMTMRAVNLKELRDSVRFGYKITYKAVN